MALASSTILKAICAVAIAVFIQHNNAASGDVAQKVKHYVCAEQNNSGDGINSTKSAGLLELHQDVVKEDHNCSMIPASFTETQHLALTYFRQPERFVKIISDCVNDDLCHIFFLHVPKTGGSTIEYQFYELFPPEQLSDPNIMYKSGSCCHNTMMRRFEADKAAHCYAKFSAYTVSVQQFLGVLDECRDMLNEEQHHLLNKPHRLIGLFSIREPHSRTISMVHEVCNFHYGRWALIKSKLCREFGDHPEDMGPICSGIFSDLDLVKEACEACDCAQHPSYWNIFLEEISIKYSNLLGLSHTKLQQTEIMSLNLNDLDSFFGNLNASLPEKFHEKFQPNTRINTETTTHCNFGMTSETFRRLENTSKVYLKLTLGL
jgi:hypothetical protein